MSYESELKPWEREASFHDAINEWLDHAPWLAISLAAHLIVFLVVQAIPWNLFQRPQEVEIQAGVDPMPEPVFEDPPPEEEEPVDEEVIEEIEPVIQDSDVVEEPLDLADLDDFQQGDPDAFFDTPFDDRFSLGEIGLGGGGPRDGLYGRRFGRGPRGGSGTEPALLAGLEWLARHQDADGAWDCDGFMKHDPPGDRCTGPGGALHDVGVSSLALLAFLGRGNTLAHGEHRDVVARGTAWLRRQQDPDSGLIGEPIGKDFVYDHALASLAMCEAYHLSRSAMLRGPAQRSLAYVLRARNPYGVWRYDVPSIGQGDTSVTGWMVFALAAGRHAELAIDEEAMTASLLWIDEMTDPATGRVGYDAPGSPSSRVPGVNAHYPAEKGEAMTAVGLLCRFFLGQDPADEPAMRRHADRMLRTPPDWDPDGFGCDMYYWYYGSYAMFQMGGRHWKEWRAAMEPAVLRSQRADGAHAGSWDPVGPWGHAGGRVYSTAIMSLCLEVYFRYPKLTGAR